MSLVPDVACGQEYAGIARRAALGQHVAALQKILARSQQDAGAMPGAEADRPIPGR